MTGLPCSPKTNIEKLTAHLRFPRLPLAKDPLIKDTTVERLALPTLQHEPP